jgi:low affinity Fe/Cu permease
MKEWFHRFASKVSTIAGAPSAFAVSIFIIVSWAVTGPLFNFSNTWQLIINTGTTIITFLMVFLIQNTQNRDNKAIHLKLDELIRVNKQARDSLIDLEDMSDDELSSLDTDFRELKKSQKLEK